MLGNRWKNGKDTVEQKKVKPKYPNRWLPKNRQSVYPADIAKG